MLYFSLSQCLLCVTNQTKEHLNSRTKIVDNFFSGKAEEQCIQSVLSVLPAVWSLCKLTKTGAFFLSYISCTGASFSSCYFSHTNKTLNFHAFLACHWDSVLSIITNIADRRKKENQHSQKNPTQTKLQQSLNTILVGKTYCCILFMKACRHLSNR